MLFRPKMHLQNWNEDTFWLVTLTSTLEARSLGTGSSRPRQMNSFSSLTRVLLAFLIRQNIYFLNCIFPLGNRKITHK